MEMIYSEVPAGSVWRHYKGDLYRVLAVATMSNGCREGEPAVVYEGMKWEPGTNVRVRTIAGPDGWFEPVGPGELRDGRMVYRQRFERAEWG